MTRTHDWDTGALGFPARPLPDAPTYRKYPKIGDEKAIFTSSLFSAEDAFAGVTPRGERATLTLRTPGPHQVLPDGVRVSLSSQPDRVSARVEFTRNASWWVHGHRLEALAVTRMVTRVTRATWLVWHLTGLLGGDPPAVDAAVRVLSADGAWADAVAAGWAASDGRPRPEAA